ncbi:spermatogenesis-associated protein 22 isoform X2 [Pseudophryne corroboree]|uniref:spermatogenesis-associated protein 22 isoform X2 n=1 Tax=Pseudophryne corroboree TaxID=495146 RepID=UPI0030818760
MKRSFPAFLPVPIFNQKKRNRQPLTSVPQKNDSSYPGINLGYESLGFSSMVPDSVGGSRISQLSNAGKKLDSRSADKKINTWPEGENVFYSTSKDINLGPKRYYGQMQMLENGKGQVINDKYVPQVQLPIQLSQQTSISSRMLLHYSSAMPSGKKDYTPSYYFKNSALLNKDNAFADMPEEEMVQAIPLYQMTVKEKSNSLRIIPASIESMKYWSQYTDRTPLLFELLATLDSAVTSGDHGSKLFLLRDGKNHIPCIFFEISSKRLHCMFFFIQCGHVIQRQQDLRSKRVGHHRSSTK